VNVTTSRVNDRYILFENRRASRRRVPERRQLESDASGHGDDTTYYEPGATRVQPGALANQITDLGKTTRTLANGRPKSTSCPFDGQVTVGLDYSAGGRQIYFPIANPLGRTLGTGSRVYSQDNNTKTCRRC